MRNSLFDALSSADVTFAMYESNLSVRPAPGAASVEEVPSIRRDVTTQ